jgi:hypothetical protein
MRFLIMNSKIQYFPGYVAGTWFSPAIQTLSDEEKGKLLGRIDKAISAKIESLASKILQSKPKTEEKEVAWDDMLLKGEDVTAHPDKSSLNLLSYLIPSKTFIIMFKNPEGAVLARTNIRKID